MSQALGASLTSTTGGGPASPASTPASPASPAPDSLPVSDSVASLPPSAPPSPVVLSTAVDESSPASLPGDPEVELLEQAAATMIQATPTMETGSRGRVRVTEECYTPLHGLAPGSAARP